MDSRPDNDPAPAKSGASLATDLSIMRTQYALDRTQLAWVRTGFTFITAGFAIDKVAEVLHRDRVIQGKNWVEGSHVTGLILIGGATLFLGLATISYVRTARKLAPLLGEKPPLIPSVLPMSLLVLIAGVVLIILVKTTG